MLQRRSKPSCPVGQRCAGGSRFGPQQGLVAESHVDGADRALHFPVCISLADEGA